MNVSSHLRLSAALFLLSVAAVLFSLAVFRLISFFIMPSLFFDLLLVGFPLGAAVATLLRGDPERRFRQSLPVFQAVMVLTIGATLFLQHFDVMRGNLLFGVKPEAILGQITVFSALYLPFFMAYGAAEYLGYLAGRAAMDRRMGAVYALFLFGAAGAFLLSLSQQSLGLTRLLVLAVALLSVVKLLLAPRRPAVPVLELALAFLVMAFPGTDRRFMQLFKSDKFGTVANQLATEPSTSLYSGWGKFSYFEVLEVNSPLITSNLGFYNDLIQWGYVRGPLRGDADFRSTVLMPLARESKRVAVIGAGGGYDIKLAHEAGASEILALEVEPAVPRVLRTVLKEQFESVYDLPGTEVVVGDARTYLENSDRKFDMIFFWSVGGYPQLMLEPGNMIRTAEALRGFMRRLTDQGVFVLGYTSRLDPDKVLLRQYATTISGIGSHVVGYQSAGESPEYMLIAFSPDIDELRLELRSKPLAHLPPSVIPISEDDLIQRDFSPVTDDKPYLAGNIRTILTPEHVIFLFKVLGTFIAVLSAVAFAGMGRSLKGRQPGPWRLLFLSLLLGANFVLLKHLCVLEIFRHWYVYYDAVILGITTLLTLSGIGSYVLRGRKLLLPLAAALVAAGVWMALLGELSLAASGLILALMVLASGSMFPTVFDLNPAARFQIFGMDAIGAAVGALLAFFVPILFGLAFFRTVALALFIGTAGYMLYMHRGLPQSYPQEVQEP